MTRTATAVAVLLIASQPGRYASGKRRYERPGRQCNQGDATGARRPRRRRREECRKDRRREECRKTADANSSASDTASAKQKDPPSSWRRRNGGDTRIQLERTFEILNPADAGLYRQPVL